MKVEDWIAEQEGTLNIMNVQDPDAWQLLPGIPCWEESLSDVARQHSQ